MALIVHSFESSNPVRNFDGRQAKYLHDYLVELNATTVVEETEYFDRDFLAEYSAFYSTSTKQYFNRCRRLHFFSEVEPSLDSLQWALSGDSASRDYLQKCYLGFSVIRPIPAAPFGRTVLRWYEDRLPQTPRVTASRTYTSHLLGIPLSVTGLAWQQQDSAVGACATIALWSLVHSSAYDEFHGIPTTADLTQFANRRAAFGSRVFPSAGLTLEQILEAIKECGLAPVVLSGQRDGAGARSFRPDALALYLGTLLRSGFPVILTGRHDQGGAHAICAVGFRDVAPLTNGVEVGFQDGLVTHLYAHDDNIGPNVRLRIVTGPNGEAMLLRDPPPPIYPNRPSPSRQDRYPALIPDNIIAAVPEALRTSPTELLQNGLRLARVVSTALMALQMQELVTVGVRYSKVADYQGSVLATALRTGDSLARVRLAFSERVPPLSLHIGVVRISVGGQALLDLVYDTSDNDRHLAPVCHVLFDSSWKPIIRNLSALIPFGIEVSGDPD